MAEAGYVLLLVSRIDDTLLADVLELVPKISELRLLMMPSVLDDEVTG